MDDLDEILDDNVAIERDSLDYLDDILELNDEELEPDDTEVLDDEFIESHLIPVNTNTIQNFPFVEDDIDAITDYELFSKGFGYLDDKKANKEELSEYVKKDEIPPLDDFVTKDTTELENYTLTEDLSSVALSGSYNDLTDKPVIPDVSNFVTKDTTELENYTLTSDLSSVATTGDYDDLINKPTIPVVPTNISAFTNDSGYITKNVNDLTNYTLTSNLSNVATSGSYNDLSDKPTIPDVSNFITKDVNDLTYYTLTSNLSSVATSGNYNDLSNKPTIPTVPSNVSAFNNDAGYITNAVNDLTNYTDTNTLTSLLANKENVIETGSNIYGNWIKLSNGILIQYGSIDISGLAVNNSYGGLYYNLTSSYSLPKTFTTRINCIATLKTNGVGNVCINNFTNSSISFKVYNGSSLASISGSISWIAIGTISS